MKNEKKIQIIKAAQKRLSKHGLHKTTLDEIARDLRMGKATLYYYFQSKEDIFYATVEFEISQLTAEIAEIFSNETAGKEQKLTDYLIYKETALNKFPVLAQLYSFFMKETANDRDSEMIKALLAEETKLVSGVLNPEGKSKEEILTAASALAVQSWGNCLTKKISPFNEVDLKIVYVQTAKI